jgi:diguanylate cyclase (GGDEF)-like protein
MIWHGDEPMDFNEYNEIIKEWIDQVLANHTVKLDVTKEYCKKLIHHGLLNGDSKILGFAYYYLAESYFFENKYNKFIKNLIQGLEYQQEASMGNLLARSYNILGINSDNLGNIPAAIDYYLTSLKYSQEYDLTYESGLANTNIGQIYVLLKDYKTAIIYLEKALKFFHKDTDSSDHLMKATIIETMIGTCYFHLGDMKIALNYFNKIENERDKYLADTHYQMVIFLFEVSIYNVLGEYNKRDELIKTLIHLMDGIPSLLDMYDEAFMLCDLLMEIGRYDDLWKTIEKMDELTKPVGITNMQLRILKLKMQYYTALNNEAEYLQTCADYVNLTEQLDEENKAIAKRAIELRMDLEKVREKQLLIQEENKILLEKSQRDPLTKLPNRDKLNEYSEIAFERALQYGTNLAIEIFDIDYFKQYNDTYGHQAGDKCLKAIAKLLHSLIEKDIFCARYGGDEFIIIYENMTDEEVLKIAGKLQQDVINLNLKLKTSSECPVVTISQGIRNSVPKVGNKIWDYFYVADMAMYHVKRNNKNDIRLMHSPVSS